MALFAPLTAGMDSVPFAHETGWVPHPARRPRPACRQRPGLGIRHVLILRTTSTYRESVGCQMGLFEGRPQVAAFDVPPPRCIVWALASSCRISAPSNRYVAESYVKPGGRHGANDGRGDRVLSARTVHSGHCLLLARALRRDSAEKWIVSGPVSGLPAKFYARGMPAVPIGSRRLVGNPAPCRRWSRV
jgi:hypothetical protein